MNKEVENTELDSLKRDKLLLDLTLHYYDEEVQRNELIDSKNNQMIIFSGSMLTLQVTLFTNLLIQNVLNNPNVIYYSKILVVILMLLNILFYIITIWKFIQAYTLKDNFFFSSKTVLYFR